MGGKYKMKCHLKPFVFCLAIPLLTGALSGFLTQNEMKSFSQLKQPPLSPPGWLFPTVWIILYILMGFACYLVWSAPKSQSRSQGLVFYGIQLVVNFLWPLFFFNAKWYFFAFGWLLLLWYLVFTTQKKFRAAAPKSGNLLIPYLLWLTFAGYLNLAIAILN